MHSITSFTLLSLSGLFFTVQFFYSEANDQLEHDVVDAFKVFEDFPSAVAFYDEDRDGDIDCLSAVRTELDMDNQAVTYIWQLKNQNGLDSRNITYHFEAGATPDKPLVTVNGASDSQQVGDFVYTDYKTCVITLLPYKGRQECILWTSDDVKRDVPQQCTDKYRAICNVEAKPYDESCDAV